MRGSNQKARARSQPVLIMSCELRPAESSLSLSHTHTHTCTFLFLLPSCFLTPVSVSVASSTSDLKGSSAEFRAALVGGSTTRQLGAVASTRLQPAERARKKTYGGRGKGCGGGGLKSIRSSETLRIYRRKEGIQRDIESMEGASIGPADR